MCLFCWVYRQLTSEQKLTIDSPAWFKGDREAIRSAHFISCFIVTPSNLNKWNMHHHKSMEVQVFEKCFFCWYLLPVQHGNVLGWSALVTVSDGCTSWMPLTLLSNSRPTHPCWLAVLCGAGVQSCGLKSELIRVYMSNGVTEMVTSPSRLLPLFSCTFACPFCPVCTDWPFDLRSSSWHMFLKGLQSTAVCTSVHTK